MSTPYRTAAEQAPAHNFSEGDAVRLLNSNGTVTALYGTVTMVADDLVGVDIRGGGYFQCRPHRWQVDERENTDGTAPNA